MPRKGFRGGGVQSGGYGGKACGIGEKVQRGVVCVTALEEREKQIRKSSLELLCHTNVSKEQILVDPILSVPAVPYQGAPQLPHRRGGGAGSIRMKIMGKKTTCPRYQGRNTSVRFHSKARGKKNSQTRRRKRKNALWMIGRPAIGGQRRSRLGAKKALTLRSGSNKKEI